MKLLFKNIILFFVFTLLVVLSIQLAISLKISGKSISGTDNLDQTSNVNADLVFLGSSRCWSHFDPRFFNQTFNIKSVNIGVNGHNELTINIIRLKYYLSRNRPPKYVILSFDPGIDGGAERDKNYISKDVYSRYAFFPNQKMMPFLDYFKYNTCEKYIPLYALFKYQILRDCLFKKPLTNYEKYGFGMQEKKWDTILWPVSDKNKKNYFKKSEIPSITNLLNELNQLCLKSNIKLLCIQTPVYKVLQDDWAFSQTKKICDSLNIPFVDANKEEIRNDMKCFYNGLHLSKTGVEQMNQFLEKDSTLISFFRDHKKTN
ncbi:hypothetical protein [Flavobacterium psychrotolerans]|uniref:SGNH/GDSL hydrolase family protein n=1 Tax=Flavobacterium psychrotolerans TaxID=2169410 RepID=A0A2U1JFM4_9FLAO|nr:hypothetical protein [Flavobacterium psychrotolerans]PWA03897.1 hypothetical protein DB895_13845 [Flavobacterium psychrotolerans]